MRNNHIPCDGAHVLEDSPALPLRSPPGKKGSLFAWNGSNGTCTGGWADGGMYGEGWVDDGAV